MLTGVRTVANCWSVHSISWSHSTFDCYCYTMIWFTQMLYLHIPSDEASRDGACVLDYKCPSCRFGFAFAFLLFLFKSAIVILFPSSLVCSFYISLDNQSDQVRRLNASLIFFFWRGHRVRWAFTRYKAVHQLVTSRPSCVWNGKWKWNAVEHEWRLGLTSYAISVIRILCNLISNTRI